MHFCKISFDRRAEGKFLDGSTMSGSEVWGQTSCPLALLGYLPPPVNSRLRKLLQGLPGSRAGCYVEGCL